MNLRNLKVYFNFNDWWIGYYKGDKHHYICPLPTIVFQWDRKNKELEIMGIPVKISNYIPTGKMIFVNPEAKDLIDKLKTYKWPGDYKLPISDFDKTWQDELYRYFNYPKSNDAERLKKLKEGLWYESGS